MIYIQGTLQRSSTLVLRSSLISLHSSQQSAQPEETELILRKTCWTMCYLCFLWQARVCTCSFKCLYISVEFYLQVIILILITCKFLYFAVFIMFTVIAEYVTIYLLAKKTIVTSSIDVFDPVHVVSNVKTPYSLIITTIAVLFKSSIIVHLMCKIRSLPEDSPVNNETLPPPYQSLSNVASTQNNPYTTTTTRRPGSRSTTPTPVYYGSSDATQPLLSEPREVFPNYHGNNTMERPLPNAPAHYNPFDERSDQPWSTITPQMV